MRRHLCRNIVLLGIGTALLVTAGGCGLGDVDVPENAPTAAQIKEYSDAQIVALEQAIRKNDPRLPARVRGLTRYLRGLQMNISVAPGGRFQNRDEAVRAIDQVIAELLDWFTRELARGTSGEPNLAALQKVLDEAKEVLRNVQVKGQNAR